MTFEWFQTLVQFILSTHMQLQPVVFKRYTLTDGPGGGNDALLDVISQSGGARGKLVIVP